VPDPLRIRQNVGRALVKLKHLEVDADGVRYVCAYSRIAVQAPSEPRCRIPL
jgi:hypothetical protein